MAAMYKSQPIVLNSPTDTNGSEPPSIVRASATRKGQEMLFHTQRLIPDRDIMFLHVHSHTVITL